MHWNGQAVAVVVAETLEQAEHAASLVRVEYEPDTAQVSFEALKATPYARRHHRRTGGSRDRRCRESAGRGRRDRRSTSTARRGINHNAIELHATIAAWNDDGTLTVFESTQFVNGYKHLLAEVFSLKPDGSPGAREVRRRRIRRQGWRSGPTPSCAWRRQGS